MAEYLQEAGHPAGNSIATWQRHGSVCGGDASSGRKQSPAHDPYQVVSESLLDKGCRQELFSFAAATTLDLGQAETLALLTTRDCAARLQFVVAAVEPYLAEQRARASVAKALGDAS